MNYNIRTRLGDNGYTSALNGKKVRKSAPIIWAVGDLDELGAYLGIIKVKARSRSNKEIAERIQRTIQKISAEIAGYIGQIDSGVTKKDLDYVEGSLDKLGRSVNIGRNFCFSGGTEASAFLDIARTVARRAERTVVDFYTSSRNGARKSAAKNGKKNGYVLKYLNALSDLLFLMSRAEG